MNLGGIILSWNAAAERIFGYRQAEVVGRSAAMLFPPELRGEESRLLQRVQAGERIQRHETIRLTKSCERIDVSLTISPLTDSAGALVGAAEIARDITERNRATRALSSVSRRLIHAQEEERARIARELHDDIGQRVALLSVELTELSKGPRKLEQTTKLQRLASDIASDVHALSHKLHSSKLELLGMTAAMNAFCREFAAQHHVTVDFDSQDVPRELPSEISLCLFRILQEALHNAAKHSGAEQMSVRLWEATGEIHLAVSDYGQGFEIGVARTGSGLGLVSMEERLKLVAGRFSLDTHPGHGTRVQASVPLRSAGRV
jgi:PAS domain S-box-containing protein